MKITTHLLLATTLLLGGCPDPTTVDIGGSDGSAGSSTGTGTLVSTTEAEATTGIASTSTASTTTSGLDGTADGSDTGQPLPPIPRATVIMQTSGGGRVSSLSHSARIRIGAPQPVGRTDSLQHHLYLGPGAPQ